LGARDVAALRRLAAGAQQDDQCCTSLHGMDAIAWSVVNSHFADALTDLPHFALQVPRQTLHARRDDRSCRGVPESGQPSGKRFGFAYLRNLFVAYKLQMNNC
jgi:hypothetical protein